ncbi:hypothetical protein ACQP25_33575 [Microtetraspora malaysiensis]|uniref:hypothetical protein n=1 Tax=Microtetraspora malaysiensis TaxID=161358 RepID=UPI003D8F43C4
MPNPPSTLSAGRASASEKLFLLISGAVVGAITLASVRLIAGARPHFASEPAVCEFVPDDAPPAAVASLGCSGLTVPDILLACVMWWGALAPLIYSGIAIAGVFRFRAVLTGTTVSVRKILRTKHADLATADVRIDTVLLGLPRLNAKEPGRRKLRLVLDQSALGFSGKPLPDHELVRLAEALESGMPTRPHAAQAAQAAAFLRRLAIDPLAHLP